MPKRSSGTLGEEPEADESGTGAIEDEAMDLSEEACESEAGDDDPVVDFKEPIDFKHL